LLYSSATTDQARKTIVFEMTLLLLEKNLAAEVGQEDHFAKSPAVQHTITNHEKSWYLCCGRTLWPLDWWHQSALMCTMLPHFYFL
jgi:hypothetical protein